MRVLKDPHKNAEDLAEVMKVLEFPPIELALSESYDDLIQDLKAIADENLTVLEFAFELGFC